MNVNGNIAAANAMYGDPWPWPGLQHYQQYCGRCGTYHYGNHMCWNNWTVQPAPTITIVPSFSLDDVKRIVAEALKEHDAKADDRLVAALERLAGVLAPKKDT